MLGIVTPSRDNWFKRPRERTASALPALDRLIGCSEASDGSQRQGEWVQEETKR